MQGNEEYVLNSSQFFEGKRERGEYLDGGMEGQSRGLGKGGEIFLGRVILAEKRHRLRKRRLELSSQKFNSPFLGDS